MKFDVNGFKYKGSVEVVYNDGSDLFDVYLGSKCVEGVYADELVSVIDGEVERTNDYQKRVRLAKLKTKR